MPKRKSADGQSEGVIPIPIQSFLWRQTSPFLRPKMGKLCEASCVSFERVLVQNISHGLSPSLCEALQSVSRWKMIQAALPHVMHCTSALLAARKLNNPDAKFNSNEIKLLYTLHWIILDSASECEDLENERLQFAGIQKGEGNNGLNYMHSLDTIQLFVYLFAPLIHSLKDSDFQSLKLENGLRLWQPLWDYRQPDVLCFSTPVKAKRVVLKAQRNLLKVNFNTANIYIGKGSSNDNIYLGFDDAPGSRGSVNEDSSPMAPLAHLSDICALSTTTATSVEIVCEICEQIMVKNEGGELSCKCGVRRSSFMSSASDGRSLLQRVGTPIDKEYVVKRLENAIASGTTRCDPSPDVLSASYFDVAVLRCLFCPQWAEEGIYWALRYIHQRLLEVCDEVLRVEYHRQRSKSLPTPEIPIICEPTPPTPPTPTQKEHPQTPSPQDQKTPPQENAPNPEKEHRKEPAFKRMRVHELKQILGEKVKQLRRRESVEQFDLNAISNASNPATSPKHHQCSKEDLGRVSPEYLPNPVNGSHNGNTADTPPRSSSALGKLTENDDDSYEEDKESGDSSSDIIRRKSMPALRRHKKQVVEDEDDDSSGSGKTSGSNKDAVTRALSLKPELLQKPIITITQDSPDPTPSHPGWASKRQSIMSERVPPSHKSLSLQRSLTDSNISYDANEDIEEVPGSIFYIQNNGQMNYRVILQAAHAVSIRECSSRLCGVLLNILNCLLDLNVIEKKEEKKRNSDNGAEKDRGKKEKGGRKVEDDLKKEGCPGKKHTTSAFSIAMETMVRIFKALGCPHGCGDGYRSAMGDHLRAQGVSCLSRLMKTNPPEFRKYLRHSLVKQPTQDIMDFLHAFMGFCVDPSNNVYSPQAAGIKRSGSQEGSTSTGYANNFGKPAGGTTNVEDQVVAQTLKPLVTKMVDNWKEMHSHENIGLYCDVRQFLNYVKEVHGGTFRCVALSGLMDALPRPLPGSEEAKTTRVIRRTPSSSNMSLQEDGTAPSGEEPNNAKSRRSIFRRKTKKMTPAQVIPGTASDSEMLEEGPPPRHGRLSPRVSMSATEDEPTSGPSTPKRKFSKFNIAWKKSMKSDHDDDSASDVPSSDSKREGKDSQSGQGHQRPKARMSFRAASQATLSFLSARKRIEDGLKNWSRRKLSKRGSFDEVIRRGSHDIMPGYSTEVIIVREKKLVNSYAVKSGMLRFNLMLDCCHPGSVPDPHLMAALLDLDAPVVARAALLLECALFVNRCNRGDWPNWMKLNLPGFRQMGLLNSRGQPSGYRRNIILQRAAGRMFHQWGEALGNRMWDLLNQETPDRFTIIHQIKDDSKKKELKLEEDEEDFLDEASVNPSGSDCPYSLKMIACQLLLEITTFLRETYQYIPKARTVKRDAPWDKPVSSRRWSSVLSSPGQSERSNSRSSQGEACHNVGSERRVSFAIVDPSRANSVPQVVLGRSPSDRKISFAVFGQSERSDSVHSSTTTISQMDVGGEGKAARRITAGRKLLKTRRGSGHNSSFRQNRSFKLKRGQESGGGGSLKRTGSARTRKVSTQSLKSEKSDEDQPQQPPVDEDILLGDDVQEGPDLSETDDQDYSTYMPWIKVVVQLSNTSNFICDHQNFCHPNCYERQRRSCTRLVTALRKIQESELGDQPEPTPKDRLSERRDTLKEKLKRRESMFQPSSPTRRRESTPLLQQIKIDASMKARLTEIMEKKQQETKKPQKKKEDTPMLKYLKTQVQSLTHSPMSIVSKSAPILAKDTFIDMMPVAWELLMESDQELAAAAATVFMLSAVRASDQVQELMLRELQHEDVSQRINAVLRFGVLWRFRWQVWPRMEDGANMYFKVPPPSIDFVLPSPTIGMPHLVVVDPPWTPHFKTKVEEVTINQDESKSFVTATTTRRKQQQEMIHRALLAEEDRRRAARENFHMTSVPVMQMAAYEPALHHASEEHEEAVQIEEICLAARRMSVAPFNRASNVGARGYYAGRSGSMFTGRPTIFEGEEERVEHLHSHHMQLAQHFFPSCICGAALPIIHLLEDLEVNADGVSVSEVTEKVIWWCLVEEPTLFLRTFLEKLTNKDRQEELIYLLRKLMFHMPDLPAQAAHSLFNYLVGFVMFYVRSPAEGGQDAIAEALSILWQVIPSVHGIFFKDLKQTLRKEQCDPTLLITANMPSAKKLIVHGPDLSSIPSQFPIHEDTQFVQILQDSLDFFNIPEEQHGTYYIVDTKTNQMHNLNSYVRDFYFFRRNHYPQLSLVKMNSDQASIALQRQAFTLKGVEMGKVLFTMAILRSTNSQQIQNHVSFLHEELMKLPSFPRKALEADFGLHHGEFGKEVFGVDMLHKYVWTKLMAVLFKGMSSTITWAGDLPLFLNVVNGTLLLHTEDTSLLRLCLSTYINASRHFKQVFATTGFLFIMPTILRAYSNHQANPVVCQALEFVCHQFFLLHRNPFVLQMFGSVAPILDPSDDRTSMDVNKVDPQALFSLLLALEKECPDHLDVLELVEGEKPLMALDFCYIDDPDTFTLIDAINMCVTVVAYACDSARAMEMLTVIEAILPYYLAFQKKQTTKKDSLHAVREELNIISGLAVAMRALISSCEAMTRSFSGPQRHLETASTHIGKPTQNHSNHSPQAHSVYYDEPSDIRFVHMEEGTTQQQQQRHRHTQDDDVDVQIKEFRKPRNSLLCVVAEFYHHCTTRVKELRKQLIDPSVRVPELLDCKAHMRLADIAQTLLKVAPYDTATMKCKGFQRYITDILPITDWSQESVRPVLNLVLRRLERLFSRMHKKPILRRNLDWDAAANLLKGVYNTLAKFTYIAHLPHLKTLINVCLNIILADESCVNVSDSLHSMQHRPDGIQARVGAPPAFCSAVIKLTAMQMQALGDQYSLEHICGGMSVFPTAEKTANMLVSLILPLCIRMGCGRRDTPKMRQQDINFALTIMLHALVPPFHQGRQAAPGAGGGKAHQLSVSDIGRTGSMSSNKGGRGVGPQHGPKDVVLNVAFLGLKVVMVCFEKQLSTEWYRIAQCIKDLGCKLLGGVPLWRFLDFVVTIKTPLYMNLQPFIQYKMMKVMCETEQEYFLQHLVHQKLQGFNMPHPKCKSTVLVELATELRHTKEELLSAPIGDMRPRTSTIATDRSDYSHRAAPGGHIIPRTTSIHDLLEQQVNARLQALVPGGMGGSRKYTRASKSSISSQTAPSVLDALHKLTADTTAVMSQTTHTGSGNINRQATTDSSSSPALHRKSSQRISAHEGSRILEKFLKKPSVQEDDGNGGAGEAPQYRPSTTSPRKLQRQASFYQRGTLSKQASVCSQEAISENAEGEAAAEQQASKPPLLRALSAKLLRRVCVVHRGRLKRQQSAVSPSSMPVHLSDNDPSDLEPNGLDPDPDPAEVDHNMNLQGPSSPKTTAPCSPLNKGAGGGSGIDLTDSDISSHRLQRQDAKSRKTFKIKRHRSTIKGNIMRSATMKGSIRCQPPKPHMMESPVGSFGNILETMETPQEEAPVDAVEGDGPGVNDRSAAAAAGKTGLGNMEDVPPTIVRMSSALGSMTDDTSSMNGKVQQPSVVSRRAQFIKSKSQDDASSHSIMGRRRIARQGARIVRSRSPSMSPARGRSPNMSPSQSQAYVAKCDSIESIPSTENCALLKKENQSQSNSSLLIFFDGNDMQDTCV